MSPFIQSWLVPLIRFHCLIAGLLLGGFALWARAARRRPHAQLAPGPRVVLALLLAATPFSWWLTGQGLEPKLTMPASVRFNSDAPGTFTARAFEEMEINRLPDEIKGDHIERFEAPDGTAFLFLHAPGSLTFNLRVQDRRLEVDYGFMRSAYADGGRTNGAILRIEIRPAQGKAERLFEYYARPVEREADRKLLHATVALPRRQAGDRLVVSFLPGDNDDNSWDHTFIRRLRLE